MLKVEDDGGSCFGGNIWCSCSFRCRLFYNSNTLIRWFTQSVHILESQQFYQPRAQIFFFGMCLKWNPTIKRYGYVLIDLTKHLNSRKVFSSLAVLFVHVGDPWKRRDVVQIAHPQCKQKMGKYDADEIFIHGWAFPYSFRAQGLLLQSEPRGRNLMV